MLLVDNRQLLGLILVYTDIMKGKEFFITANDDEFCKSYKTSLPRDDVASRLRLFFMGN